MKPWLKAGLIGGAFLTAWTFTTTLSFILPLEASLAASCCLCLPFFLAYPAVGALAAYWMPAPRDVGSATKEGTLAGLVAGIIAGLADFIWLGAMIALRVMDGFFAQLPPGSAEILRERGLYWWFTPGGLAVTVCFNNLFMLVWAVACGAAGGALLAALKPRTSQIIGE